MVAHSPSSLSTSTLLLLLLLLLGEVTGVVTASSSTVIGKLGQGLVAMGIVAPSLGQGVGEREEAGAGGVDCRGDAGGGDQRLGSGRRPEMGRPQMWAWQRWIHRVLTVILAWATTSSSPSSSSSSSSSFSTPAVLFPAALSHSM